MLNKAKKDRIIKKFQTHEGDTGSSQVQIAILTEELKELQEHLQTHKKDHSSRRGLLRKVNQRRKLLNYLMREDGKAYEELINALKLKRRISQFVDFKNKLEADKLAAAEAAIKLEEREKNKKALNV